MGAGNFMCEIDNRVHFIAVGPVGHIAQCLYDAKTDVTETMVMEPDWQKDQRVYLPVYRERIDFKNRTYARKNTVRGFPDMSMTFDQLSESAREYVLEKYRPQNTAAT